MRKSDESKEEIIAFCASTKDVKMQIAHTFVGVVWHLMCLQAPSTISIRVLSCERKLL